MVAAAAVQPAGARSDGVVVGCGRSSERDGRDDGGERERGDDGREAGAS
jgi:hypothetical protein